MNKIKLLIMDVDGTLTDGKVYIGNSGELFKGFNIKDGLGIHNILPQIDIIPAIITGRESSMLEIRCKELGIKYLYQGVADKISVLENLMGDLNVNYEECAYIGDDINDLECMSKVNIKGCPADAVDEIIEICDFVSTKAGGEGAVREFIDYLKQVNKG